MKARKREKQIMNYKKKTFFPATNAEASMCPMTASYRLKGPIGPPSMSSRHKRNHHERTNHHTRHGTLSFRNNDELIDEEQLRLTGRSLSPRHRRDLTAAPVVDDDEAERNKRQAQGCFVDYNSARRLRIGCTRQDVIDVNPSCSEEGEEGEKAKNFLLTDIFLIFLLKFFFSQNTFAMDSGKKIRRHLLWPSTVGPVMESASLSNKILRALTVKLSLAIPVIEEPPSHKHPSIDI